MKKILAAFVAVVAISFASCGGNSTTENTGCHSTQCESTCGACQCDSWACGEDPCTCGEEASDTTAVEEVVAE